MDPILRGKVNRQGCNHLAFFLPPPHKLGNKSELTNCVCDRRTHRAWRGFRANEMRRGEQFYSKAMQKKKKRPLNRQDVF